VSGRHLLRGALLLAGAACAVLGDMDGESPAVQVRGLVNSYGQVQATGVGL